MTSGSCVKLHNYHSISNYGSVRTFPLGLPSALGIQCRHDASNGLEISLVDSKTNRISRKTFRSSTFNNKQYSFIVFLTALDNVASQCPLVSNHLNIFQHLYTLGYNFYTVFQDSNISNQFNITYYKFIINYFFK